MISLGARKARAGDSGSAATAGRAAGALNLIHTNNCSKPVNTGLLALFEGSEMTTEKQVFTFELTEKEALSLSQFVKRVGWSEMRGCAQDDQEAFEIRAGISALAAALREGGYDPR